MFTDVPTAGAYEQPECGDSTEDGESCPSSCPLLWAQHPSITFCFCQQEFLSPAVTGKTHSVVIFMDFMIALEPQ